MLELGIDGLLSDEEEEDDEPGPSKETPTTEGPASAVEHLVHLPLEGEPPLSCTMADLTTAKRKALAGYLGKGIGEHYVTRHGESFLTMLYNQCNMLRSISPGALSRPATASISRMCPFAIPTARSL